MKTKIPINHFWRLLLGACSVVILTILGAIPAIADGTVPLHNDTAGVGTDCPDTENDYWHFVLTPNDGSSAFQSITLNLDGTLVTFTGSQIIPNGSQLDNVFVQVPDGYELGDLQASGSSAVITGPADSFNLSHICEGGGSTTTTTTTALPTTTTTVAPTTTTVAPTTTLGPTTTVGTTTTIPGGGTTTTVAPTTTLGPTTTAGPTTTLSGTTTTLPSAVVTTTLKPAAPTPAPNVTIPVTGAGDKTAKAGIASALLAAGVALVLIATRRPGQV